MLTDGLDMAYTDGRLSRLSNQENDDGEFRIDHITQVFNHHTMIRLHFDKTRCVRTSGMRFRHGEEYSLEIHALLGENAPESLFLRHENQTVTEVELKVLERQEVQLVFSALDEDDNPIDDPETKIHMTTVITGENGEEYARIEWTTTINDHFG
ncbi:unnamed protein product [Bursaphelenchus okinawaensis]|uniref:Uncharacterized protein n=1 Tax=Bursaphelenchus okinawaensis TaxID=465554 RepID=A0A811JTL8_9BILA|nr:unnamed protein product [Bursaphelenchus okinawaensis]CAG9083220.1 unnamed protein product [Bursaphelenchus okinawaensis]